MKVSLLKFFLLFSSAATFTGNLVTSTSYNYSASIECLAEPPRPQYGGGIVRNPEFNDGLKGWSVFGNGQIAERTSDTGNRFMATERTRLSHQSVSQKVYLQRGMLYTFSAWLQVDQGNTTVTAIFKTAKDGFVHVGAVEARSGCWSMLKGGLTAKSSGPAEFYFESMDTSVEIWVDSVSLQPFTEDQWRAHQAESINKVRKKTVAILAVDANGHALPGASVSIQQTRSGFPLGCALKSTILQSSAYQSWFTARFTVTTFTNEMKWYSNEPVEGNETYADADAMLAFAKQHGIAVRGHNVVWDDRQYVQNWVQSLPTQKLREAVNRRFNNVMTRYRGQVIAWDVVNENVHFSYFESRLGENASSIFYQQAHQLDPHALMFLNEFNTLEVPVDGKSTPAKYLQKLQQIQSFGNLSRMAIGLEGHFGTPDISYMRSALDKLAGANVPIWLTEVDVAHSNESKHLEDILREAYSHPAVQGIVIFGVWNPKGCFSRMCLTDCHGQTSQQDDVNFKNLPTGDVVDKLISEWRTHYVAATTDADGLHRAELFHGEYKITVNHPSSNSSSVQSLTVDSASQNYNVLTVMV
ncbi:endo-1,4-beta-xylanase 5-like [Musa acuminata AAA Group]|uniref:endo-1,4-beta-xylanase 5-like n=1 Tax=Musa acuminata AAA Group TaxID=214697 RepID=UPI0031E24886